MEAMELNQPTLQEILSVVLITGVTCVALLGYLKRRDRQKLAAEFNLRREQNRLHAERKTAPPALATAVPKPSAPRQDAPQDIRQYVARRAQDWTATRP